MIVTKDPSNKFFDNINTWSETVSFIAREMREYYHCNLNTTKVQDLFGGEIILNLM